MAKTLLCWLGRHDWQHQRNPEVSGAGADFETCARCGAERKKYGPGSGSGIAGAGGAPPG
jgi:hypothetical protein